MNDLLFVKLIGSPTAIICSSQKEWDIVSYICRLKWEQPAYNHEHKNCISVPRVNTGNRGTAPWFIEQGHTLFTAAEFIRQNLEYSLKKLQPIININEIIWQFRAEDSMC